MLMRITAAMTRNRATLLECFVDDPQIALGGDRNKRTHALLIIVVLKLACGYKLSWRKGARGQNVQWIGALFKQWRSPTGVHGLSVTIAPEKIERMRKWCSDLISADVVYRSDLRQFAGLVTWVAGYCR